MYFIFYVGMIQYSGVVCILNGYCLEKSSWGVIQRIE